MAADAEHPGFISGVASIKKEGSNLKLKQLPAPAVAHPQHEDEANHGAQHEAADDVAHVMLAVDVARDAHAPAETNLSSTTADIRGARFLNSSTQGLTQRARAVR